MHPRGFSLVLSIFYRVVRLDCVALVPFAWTEISASGRVALHMAPTAFVGANAKELCASTLWASDHLLVGHRLWLPSFPTRDSRLIKAAT
jgi:hypothetical protein